MVSQRFAQQLETGALAVDTAEQAGDNQQDISLQATLPLAQVNQEIVPHDSAVGADLGGEPLDPVKLRTNITVVIPRLQLGCSACMIFYNTIPVVMSLRIELKLLTI